MKPLTRKQFKTLLELFHELPDVFRTLPGEVKDEYYAALYWPTYLFADE